MNIDKIILNAVNSKASKEEYIALEAWKSDSVKNIEFLETMMSMHSHDSTPYNNFDKDLAWNNIEDKIEESTPINKPKYGLWLLLVLSIAAAIAYMFSRNKENGTYQTQENTEHIILADNSEIWLNRSTTIQQSSDFNSERNLTLKGEAYFDVEHVDNKPFVIALNDKDYIKVIGTSFNVINENGNFDLAVYTGHVQLYILDRTIDVYEGDRVVLLDGAYVKVKNQNKNILSWKNRTLLFDNEKLESVLEELSDYYNVKFVGLDKIENQDCRLRTKFDNEPLELVLKELESHFNFKYQKTNETITIISASCE